MELGNYQKKSIPINRNNNAGIMATAYQNGNKSIVLGLESNYNVDKIEYNVSFQSDTEYKKWL